MVELNKKQEKGQTFGVSRNDMHNLVETNLNSIVGKDVPAMNEYDPLKS